MKLNRFQLRAICDSEFKQQICGWICDLCEKILALQLKLRVRERGRTKVFVLSRVETFRSQISHLCERKQQNSINDLQNHYQFKLNNLKFNSHLVKDGDEPSHHHQSPPSHAHHHAQYKKSLNSSSFRLSSKASTPKRREKIPIDRVFLL